MIEEIMVSSDDEKLKSEEASFEDQINEKLNKYEKMVEGLQLKYETALELLG
jgi:hypothetical protein